MTGPCDSVPLCMSLTSRKQEHVRLVVDRDVRFREKDNGLDAIELPYCALPECDLNDIDLSVDVFGRTLSAPFMITGMTGGYPDAERINAQLAETAAELGIAIGVGSMRAAIEQPQTAASYTVVKTVADRVPTIGNVGAVQMADWHRAGTLQEHLEALSTLIGASAMAVHLNPLQELLQPEGQPRFRGVLEAITAAVETSPVPIIVKEVGAGISLKVAEQLVDAGVDIIDVAGAGGTSWAGVEILRREDADTVQQYWDVGIPTAQCLYECRGIVPTLIASGGITSGRQAANAIALGASVVGAAGIVLRTLERDGTSGVLSLLRSWSNELRRWMFLTGSPTIAHLQQLLD